MSGGEPISVDAARELLLRHALAKREVRVDLAVSIGHVLSRAVKADRDLPPFDRAAVDGFALRLAQPWGEAQDFTILGSVAAGESYSGTLRPGTAVKVMTGAPVPRGADGVVMVERSELLTVDRVRLRGPFTAERGRAGAERPGLAPRGQDARRGAIVLERGVRIDPSHVAVLASVGCVSVPVYQRPNVSLLTTGPEVVKPSARPNDAQIRNSNGPFLRSLLVSSGVATIDGELSAPDRLSALVRAIERGSHARVLVLTGGVSMGDFDLVPQALRQCGFHPRFHRVAMRPGKPLLFATRGRGAEMCAVFALPGNPVSVLVTAWEFLMPYLRRAAGVPDPGPWSIPARAAESIERKPGLVQFVLARLALDPEGAWGVSAVPWNGSGDFVAAARANAIVPLPADEPRLREGERCMVHPLFRESWNGGAS